MSTLALFLVQSLNHFTTSVCELLENKLQQNYLSTYSSKAVKITTVRVT